jgi:hypothetical protein
MMEAENLPETSDHRSILKRLVTWEEFIERFCCNKIQKLFRLQFVGVGLLTIFCRCAHFQLSFCSGFASVLTTTSYHTHHIAAESDVLDQLHSFGYRNWVLNIECSSVNFTKSGYVSSFSMLTFASSNLSPLFHICVSLPNYKSRPNIKIVCKQETWLTLHLMDNSRHLSLNSQHMHKISNQTFTS